MEKTKSLRIELEGVRIEKAGKEVVGEEALVIARGIKEKDSTLPFPFQLYKELYILEFSWGFRILSEGLIIKV